MAKIGTAILELQDKKLFFSGYILEYSSHAGYGSSSRSSTKGLEKSKLFFFLISKKLRSFKFFSKKNFSGSPLIII